MKNHLPYFHDTGSGFHLHRTATAHHLHLNHYFDTLTHAAHLPHPLHWAHVIAYDLYALHLIHRFNLLTHSLISHADHWITEHAYSAALLLTMLLVYVLYLVSTHVHINDYTKGVWALFG